MPKYGSEAPCGGMGVFLPVQVTSSDISTIELLYFLIASVHKVALPACGTLTDSAHTAVVSHGTAEFNDPS